MNKPEGHLLYRLSYAANTHFPKDSYNERQATTGFEPATQCSSFSIRFRNFNEATRVRRISPTMSVSKHRLQWRGFEPL